MDAKQVVEEMADLAKVRQSIPMKLAGLAYRLKVEHAWPQRRILAALKEVGEPISEGKLSKMIRAYEYWVVELGFDVNEVAIIGPHGLYNRYRAAEAFSKWTPAELLDAMGFLYLILDPVSGYRKIGVTKDPINRLQAIRNASGNELDMEHLFRLQDHDVAERLLHEHFGSKRKSGEWFELSENELADFLRQVGAML